MRTTVNIDARLLAEAKLVAAREHRTIGSVMEDALRQLIDAAAASPQGRPDFRLHTFLPARTGLLPGVDLEDADLMADLLDADSGADSVHAPA